MDACCAAFPVSRGVPASASGAKRPSRRSAPAFGFSLTSRPNPLSKLALATRIFGCSDSPYRSLKSGFGGGDGRMAVSQAVLHSTGHERLAVLAGAVDRVLGTQHEAAARDDRGGQAAGKPPLSGHRACALQGFCARFGQRRVARALRDDEVGFFQTVRVALVGVRRCDGALQSRPGIRDPADSGLSCGL